MAAGIAITEWGQTRFMQPPREQAAVIAHRHHAGIDLEQVCLAAVFRVVGPLAIDGSRGA